ncbi:MAG: hypothetical protein LC643_10010, partial [Bacteroidales bacterium]|nr:hypothetical protein [Bacteroidales bacterium]
KAHKNRHVLEIVQEMKAMNIPMLLINNTEEAARHALRHGFIEASSMPDIARQVEVDHKNTGLLSTPN